jgi:hypothetical protein
MQCLFRSVVILRSLRCSLLILACSTPLLAQVQAIKGAPHPARINRALWLLPSGWATRIPPRGTVNAPGQLQVLAPGQGFEVALIADGDNREELLDGRLLTLKITTSAGVVEKRDLKPISIRPVKASGADMVMMALDAGGIQKQDRAAIERSISMVSLAVFEPGWEAPVLGREEQVRIEATIVGGRTPIPKIDAVRLRLRPWSDWQKDAQPDPASLQDLMSGFHESPQPGRLLSMLKAAARSKALKQPSVQGFFVAAFRQNSMARQEAVKTLPSLDPLSKWALLMVLRLGGEDISSMLADFPEDATSSLREIQPMKDPRIFPAFTDPVDPQAVAGIGAPMDQCWGSWMATGDPSYLRSLVGLLNGAADFEAFQLWIKTKGGTKGLNAQVARGLAYQIAGWSLSSFQRTDPQVSDWLLFWQDDPDLPLALREQIRSVPQNPAFKRTNGQG